MYKIIGIAMALLLGIACSDGMELIEEKNDQGVLLKRFTIDENTQHKEGNYTEYDENGKLLEEATFKNDALDGIRKLYYTDGNVQYIETYQQGQYHGEYQAFHENGEVQLKGTYQENEMEGEWVAYYSNGQVKERVTFKENNENGPFIEYYESGNLKAEGSYLDGDNEDGLLQLYNEQGELERKMECIKGRCTTIWKQEETNE